MMDEFGNSEVFGSEIAAFLKRPFYVVETVRFFLSILATITDDLFEKLPNSKGCAYT